MDILTGVGYWALLRSSSAPPCGLVNIALMRGARRSAFPSCMMAGLPEGVANATNRLPVLIGSVMATVSFARFGQMDWTAAASSFRCGGRQRARCHPGCAHPNRDGPYDNGRGHDRPLLMLFTKVGAALAYVAGVAQRLAQAIAF